MISIFERKVVESVFFISFFKVFLISKNTSVVFFLLSPSLSKALSFSYTFLFGGGSSKHFGSSKERLVDRTTSHKEVIQAIAVWTS